MKNRGLGKETALGRRSAGQEEWLGNHFFEELTWIEGQPVSGKPKLTLVGIKASERLGTIAERWDPSQQRILYSATITRAINRMYNANNVWYFFTATTSIDVSLQNNPELAAIAEEAFRQPGSFAEFPLGTFPQALAPEDDPQITAALNGHLLSIAIIVLYIAFQQFPDHILFLSFASARCNQGGFLHHAALNVTDIA